MSKKSHNPGPVPPGNRSHTGTNHSTEGQEQSEMDQLNETDTFQEQDPKRRLGGFSGEGEHPLQQPGRLNDGDTHSQ